MMCTLSVHRLQLEGVGSKNMRGRKAKTAVIARVAVAYIRVSTTEQAESGHSLEAQENRLKAYATGTGREIARVFIDDGSSAAILKRPALTDLLVAIKTGTVGAVYVTKLDRLSRSLRDLLELVALCEAHNVALVSASESLDTSTPAGRMMLQLLGVFAEFERGRISERISDVLSDRRKQRKVYSRNIPFGYVRSGDSLIAEPKQQAALEERRRMSAAGASLRQMAARMTAIKIHTNGNGRFWHAATVSKVLDSKMESAA